LPVAIVVGAVKPDSPLPQPALAGRALLVVDRLAPMPAYRQGPAADRGSAFLPLIPIVGSATIPQESRRGSWRRLHQEVKDHAR
jgi:hypothetical protein